MKSIIYPLRPGMQGDAVADLQDGLRELLARSIVRTTPDQPNLIDELGRERLGSSYADATFRMVRLVQEQSGLQASGEVDEATAGALNKWLPQQGVSTQPPVKYVVGGLVRLADGSSASGITVSAFGHGLRREQLLGETRTDPSGGYRIEYEGNEPNFGGSGGIDLVVKALAADGSVLAASPVLFNAPTRADIELVIPADRLAPPALIEKIGLALKPLLGDLAIDTLDDDAGHSDLAFLAGKTGLARDVLDRFVLANRLTMHGIQVEFWFALLGDSSFHNAGTSSLQARLTAILGMLPTVDAATLHRALTGSLNRNEIPQALRVRSSDWTAQFLTLAAHLTLNGADTPTFCRQALSDASVTDAGKQQTFARLFNTHKTFNAPLRDALAADASFTREEIDHLSASFQLADLTAGDFAVVDLIKKSLKVSGPDDVRKLARKSESDWRDFLDQNAAAKIDTLLALAGAADSAQPLSTALSARRLALRFKDAFPTTAFTGGLERALRNNNVEGIELADQLHSFLDRHDQFELLSTPVDDFLDKSDHPETRELAANDVFRTALKTVQRVFKLEPSFETASTLLADGIGSAQTVYRMGRGEFVNRYMGRTGFTTETAQRVWDRAADTYAAVLAVFGELNALRAGQLPAALVTGKEEDSSKFPTWNNLFKAGDLMRCDHCESVLGAAAYFVDILTFLNDRASQFVATPPLPVKDILFLRRPDLGFIELNCENTETLLPYIDIVCEVLEAAIADGESDLPLGITALPSDHAAARDAVKDAFAKPNVGIDLGTEFSLSKVNLANQDPWIPGHAPDQWVVHCDDATYLLKRKGYPNASPNYFMEILRNTKADAATLRAYPAYVNDKAYDKLRQAVRPLRLPFDLYGEEVRATFEKCKLQRWDLMRALQSLAGAFDDGKIATEYFNISSGEKRLIVLENPPAGAASPEVKWFLHETGLEYDELLALIDLTFIRKAGNIHIAHQDSSGDLDKKSIEGLDPDAMDRIYRFLRLWRKLGKWEMWELDLVIRHGGIGAGALNDAFLTQLYYFCRLRTRLGEKLAVEQLCAIIDDHYDFPTSDPKPPRSLNIETHLAKPGDKRADGLYQNAFLNRARANEPKEAAFDVKNVNVRSRTDEKISGHVPVVLAALGITRADFDLLTTLKAAGDDGLTLTNLAFLWRHAWLSKQLKLPMADWTILLKITGDDLLKFDNPQAAFAFVELADQVRASGSKPDELNWLLTADKGRNAASRDADTARFLLSLRQELQSIAADYNAADPVRYPELKATPDVEDLSALLASLLKQLNRDAAETDFALKVLRGSVSMEASISGLAAGFAFPAAINDASIPITYDESAKLFRFTGIMTEAQQAALLGSTLPENVRTNPAYTDAIRSLFQQSSAARLAVKFFDENFVTTLEALPRAIEFKTQLPAELAARISYDGEQRQLRFAGIMREAEQELLRRLVPDNASNRDYLLAVDKLKNLPSSLTPADADLWLTDEDFDPAHQTLAGRLAKAAKDALGYLSKALSTDTIVRRSSAKLGVDEAITRRLLTKYKLPAATLMADLLGTSFRSGTEIVDISGLPIVFAGWDWASRAAILLKNWQITLKDCERLAELADDAQLLDLKDLPVTPNPAARAASLLAKMTRTSRLLRFSDSLSQAGKDIDFLDVLVKLHRGGYTATADFAADVHRLNEAWTTVDVAGFAAPIDFAQRDSYKRYFLVETWEQLRRAFSFAENLGADAATVRTFAEVDLAAGHTRTLRRLLQTRYGREAWLALSTELQDGLRERKRNALADYLLTRPPPAAPKPPAFPNPPPPTGKWENTNDLYAYYLLDVEMGAGQLTSRLVQATGSVQLFVQRCFLGLEPNVAVLTEARKGDDGISVPVDSAWNWWSWMRKYRLWEANRSVFLWPENWIEPELKKDRSQFFKELQDELEQNDVDQYSVETAFTNYLDKLGGVAQLEIAGHYQEDDGADAILHVFGRTKGAEPHLYYYRRYDYRKWSPWEKIDLDIQGDYLMPAMVNRQLFLFWPVFTEMPDETSNEKPDWPSGEKPLARAKKNLQLQLAMSDYRKGKWTAKRISKASDRSTTNYSHEVIKDGYRFLAIDRSGSDGSFIVQYDGNSRYSASMKEDAPMPAQLANAFNVFSQQGGPEIIGTAGIFRTLFRPSAASTNTYPIFMKWVERSPREDHLTSLIFVSQANDLLPQTIVLNRTPSIYRISPAWQFSYFDQARDQAGPPPPPAEPRPPVPFGTGLPFFYDDKERTFLALPVTVKPKLTPTGISLTRRSYVDLKRDFRSNEKSFESLIRTFANDVDVGADGSVGRQQLEMLVRDRAADRNDGLSSYTDEQLRSLYQQHLMRSLRAQLSSSTLPPNEFPHLEFRNFYHPFVADFARLVSNPRQGLSSLMRRDTQYKDNKSKLKDPFAFKTLYDPNPSVVDPSTLYPEEAVDFSPDGAYAQYNWELFFHIPLLIANALSKNQRFEEARNWYHFIFNPIGLESPGRVGSSAISKYWITKPFFETTDQGYVAQRIENLLLILAGDTSNPDFPKDMQAALEKQVFDWRQHPFDPHLIAGYRTVAYQKTVVMKYLDNLIAWGDFLFRQDSMESVNEAIQIYILAAEILGPRPKKVTPPRLPAKTYNELEDTFDKFSEALVEVENLVAPSPGNAGGANAPPLHMLYFCIPQNDKLMSYWDTVADRLYKIRHGMNIDGVERQLALFEPPLDPADLVRAAAAGGDIGGGPSDGNAPLPLYRFSVLLQKANEVCNDVKALGAALLSALEKKDTETLGLLRQNHEIRVLEAIKALRARQIEEAKETLASVRRGKEVTEIKERYYASRELVNSSEQTALKLNTASLALDAAIAVGYTAAGGLKLIPQFLLGVSGFGGSPHATADTGGRSFGDSAADMVRTLESIARALDKAAALSGTLGSYQRRKDEWDFQHDLAVKELTQIDDQIAAAETRVAIAEKELENHVVQIENAKAVQEFMHSKYTSEELYQWQVGQISTVYFQSYKLAYDLARQAERCFRFELGVADSHFINFGYWDSLKKGLLSGDRLQYDLRRLEAAYLEQNRRELELIKHVSLTLLDPLALIKLRETGRCFFRLPEEIFDLDYPGHYLRRIKSVSLTLPCVTGPFTTISCTLRLLKNSIRVNTASGGDDDYQRQTDTAGLPADDQRFIENNIPVRAIATSSGQNDSGVFELNFHDERYLPFEGAGAISEWSLELFEDPGLRQFDYGSISDAILHVKFTAREDAGAFKARAIKHLQSYFKGGSVAPSWRSFDLRREFPFQWNRFIKPVDSADGHVLELEVSPDLFGRPGAGQTLKVNTIWILARCAKEGAYSITLPGAAAAGDGMPLVADTRFGGLHVGEKDVSQSGLKISPATGVQKWQLKLTRTGGDVRVNPDGNATGVGDMILVVGYSLE